MKKYLVLLVFGYNTMAQVSIGIKTSANMSVMSKFPLIENVIPDFKLAPSLGGGIFLELPLNGRLSFQPEVNFVQKGFKISKAVDIASKYAGIDVPLSASVKMKLRYIQAPLLIKINLKESEATKAYLLVGPAVGYLNSTGLRINVFNIVPIHTGFPKSVYKEFELSGIAALGAESHLSSKVSLLAEARYEAGLNRIVNTPVINLPVRNTSYSGSLGLKIHI